MFRLLLAVSLVSATLVGLTAMQYFNGRYPHRAPDHIAAENVCKNRAVVAVRSDDDAPIWHVTCSDGLTELVAK